jgi:G3E family GTPase
MRLLIFCGFLGSGKTTLILALARLLAAGGRRTCIVVNEVGEVGIDQQVMSDSGLSVREITSGCICCQLGSDLVATLEEVRKRFDPSVIIVEASGVATPAGILDALARYRSSPFAERRLVTLVDPTRLHVLWEIMTPLMEEQISPADDIVLTKLDLATEDELGESEGIVRVVNSRARTWRVASTREDSLTAVLTSLSGRESDD